MDGIKKGLPLSFDEFRLFNQYIQHRREYLGSTLKLEQALYVASLGRPDRGTTHILPPNLGLDAQGHGRPWNVSKLRNEGLSAAQANGIMSPTPAQILRYGLLVAAERNPLVVGGVEEMRGLMRMALFALGPDSQKHKPSAIAYVARQVKAALAKFQRTTETVTETTGDFDRWLEG